ncbi:MAG: methyltransferase [Acidimicrobiales bacterium]
MTPYSTVTPRLVFRDARSAIELYREAFAAEQLGPPHLDLEGMVVHAEIRIGNSVVYLTEEGDNGVDAVSPSSSGGRVTAIMAVTVEDVDSLWRRAVAAGCAVIYPLADQFYGEREGRLRDPFGHQWMLGSHISDLEQPRRAAEGEPSVDLDALLDLATPWCIHVAATLRIPEHIAAGHRDIADLAAVADCDRGALHAVLGHLVSKGVFREDSTGRFSNNGAAQQIVERQFLDLDGVGGRMTHAWGTLLTYVRSGKSAYEEVFGRTFWEDLAAHPRIAAEFDALMGPAGHGVPDFDVELSGGWGGVRAIVDVGGGTGSMLVSLLRRHPEVRGTLVDLPGTVARAGNILEGSGVAERVEVVGQSFFDSLPPGADLYLLKNVLNDWPDEQTVAILHRCAEAAHPRGKVVVLGGVSPDDAPRCLGIDMLVAGGRTSTLTEFHELARRAGLAVLAAGTQSSGRYVVECQPAA